MPILSVMAAASLAAATCKFCAVPLWGATLRTSVRRAWRRRMLGYAGNYGNIRGFWASATGIAYGTFYYVSGFAGYLVLAYYLVHNTLLQWSWRRTLGAIGIPMFAAGYAGHGIRLSWPCRAAFRATTPTSRSFGTSTGINVFHDDVARSFVVVRKLRRRNHVRWLARLASLTFGVYLCHFIFVQIGYDLIGTIGSLPVLARIVLTACCAFAVSAALVWLMSRWKWTWKLVR